MKVNGTVKLLVLEVSISEVRGHLMPFSLKNPKPPIPILNAISHSYIQHSWELRNAKSKAECILHFHSRDPLFFSFAAYLTVNIAQLYDQDLTFPLSQAGNSFF